MCDSTKPDPRPLPLADDEAVEAINKQLLDYFLTIDSKGRLINKPKTDDELHTFIQVAFDKNIPRKVIIEGHQSPFSFVADCFFERHRNLLGLACRAGGKTFNIAILNICEMVFKAGCEICQAGAVQEQARQAFKYFSEFIEYDWFKDLCKRYESLTGKPFLQKDNKQESTFANGALQKVIVASETGLRSPHPQKARLDEVDLMEWETLLTGFSMARNKPKDHKKGVWEDIRGQNVFISTRQNEYGSMSKLLNAAEEKDIKVYQWNIWDVLAKCDRKCQEDPVHGDCPIFTYCQGKAHECEGFYPIDDFIGKVRIIDRQRFETEWENKRPSRARMVYPMLEARHHMTSAKLQTMFGVKKPHPTWQIIAGMDFGGSPGHPFVYTKLWQMPNGAWLVAWSYDSEMGLLRDHSDAIKGSPHWKYSEFVASDWDAQDRKELRALGIHVKLANKDLEMGINLLRELLSGKPPAEEPLLYFWADNVDEFPPVTACLAEFNAYQYPTGYDGKPISAKPIKVNDNFPDSVRYALNTWLQKGPGNQYRTYSVPGL